MVILEIPTYFFPGTSFFVREKKGLGDFASTHA